ncbi:hypothetical protein NKH77_05490 [Streptomyces sp. M19]
MSVWLPNEEFLTRTGRTFDGTGIPPHSDEPVFAEGSSPGTATRSSAGPGAS